MKLRGNRPGYLFSHVNDENMVDAGRKWSTQDFTEFLRQLLRLCSVGSGVTELYPAHSLKGGRYNCIDQLWQEMRTSW